MSFRRLPSRVRINVEQLEDRNAPVASPLGQGALQILGTYGQYQDVPVNVRGNQGGRFDNSIHLHEGIDIVARAGERVNAVVAGRVDAVFRDPVDPHHSFVVIRDGQPNNLQNLGINYKHVIPNPNLAVGAFVGEGDFIGTVAPFPSPAFGPHLHIDRGPVPAAIPRDPTIRPLTPLIQDEIQRIEGRIATFQTALANAQTPQARQAIQNLINREQAALAPVLNRRDSLDRQVPPLINPLTLLGQLPQFRDQIAPTISSLEYRIAADDVLGRTRALGAFGGELAEQPRSNARYMTGTISVAGTATAWIGREALINVPLPGGAQLPSKEQRANIDLVVGAFDTTSRANNARRLNPNRFDLTITGRAFNATTGAVNSFDFSAFPTYDGVRGFVSVANTRAVYENDSSHDNRVNVPTFFYNVTNSPNLTGGNQVQGGMVGADKEFYWNADARTGTAAFTKDDGNDATNNANAAFPDDIYTVRVGATDFAGNRGTREFRVLLQNWRRTIETATTNHGPTDSFQITGGSQYRGNQTIGIHVVPAMGARPASGRSFSDAIMSTTVVTDANGNIPSQNPMDPASPAPRQYFVIADYDADGVFTPGLDAFKVISFGPSPIVRGASDVGGVNGGDLFAIDTGGLELAIDSIQFGDVPAPYFYFSGSLEKYVVLTPPHVAGSVEVSLVLATGQTIGVEDGVTNDPVTYEFFERTFEVSASLNPAPYGSFSAVTVSLAGAALSLPDDEVDCEINADGATTPSWTGVLTLVGGAAQIDMSDFEPGIYHIRVQYLGDWGVFGDDDDPRTDLETQYTFILFDRSVNQAPLAGDDFFGSPHGTAKILLALGNDEDPDGDPLTISGIPTAPTKGTATINADGTITYTPYTGAIGTDAFVYTAVDQVGGSANATVTIQLDNRSPSAANDWFGSSHGSAAILDVLVNDFDEDDNPLAVSIATAPAKGTANVNGDGTITYTPDSGATGVDTLIYFVSDGYGGTAVATATIVIDNQSPRSDHINRGSLHGDSVVLDFAAAVYDSDGDEVEITPGTPTKGTLTANGDGAYTYTPNSSASGTDSFTYTVDDGYGGTSTATVTIQLDNRAPATRYDEARTHGQSAAIDIFVLDNDYDPDGDAIAITGVSGAAKGVATIGEDDAYVTYTPNSGATGTDTFSYFVHDGHGGYAENVVVVYLDNRSPTAHDDAVDASSHGDPFPVYVLDNDRDADGDELTLTVNANPTKGTVALNSRGDAFIYTPNSGESGSDSFTYTVDDGFGGTSSATATIDLDNHGPTANDDAFGSSHGAAMVLDVLANDYDHDGTRRAAPDAGRDGVNGLLAA